MNDRLTPGLLQGAPVLDTRGRPLLDLRVSITDRCNFRCTYCMPRKVFDADYPYLARAELLSFEEILRLVRVAHGLGVRKVRLTGGEPLLRKGVEKLVESLASLPGLDLALTTNGALLAKKARDLRNAGLNRITVSLDAVDDTIFKTMNDADFPVANVLDGIAAASAAGFASLKVNTVVKRGVNEGEILPICRHFRGSGHIPRFIEFMDVGCSNGWRMDDVVPSAQVVERISAVFPLEALEANSPSETAQRWRYADGSGEVGVISSVTRAFCHSCSRLRLSTEGKLYTCLFAGSGTDVRRVLRGDADDTALRDVITDVWSGRRDRYSEMRAAGEPIPVQRIEMSYIGG